MKKGYNTAGTSITSKTGINFWSPWETDYDLLDNQSKWKSPQILDMNKGKAVFNNYNWENECNYSAKKRNKNKNDSLEDINFDSNRDTSPYRIENFLDVLHKFGISNTSIMKKLMNTPMAHINFGKELVNDMQQDISHLLVQVI